MERQRATWQSRLDQLDTVLEDLEELIPARWWVLRFDLLGLDPDILDDLPSERILFTHEHSEFLRRGAGDLLRARFGIALPDPRVVDYLDDRLEELVDSAFHVGAQALIAGARAGESAREMRTRVDLSPRAFG